MRKFLLLEDGVIPANSILRKDDVRLVSCASEIIEHTNAWSEQRRAQHEQQLAELREIAVREAHQEGIAALLQGRDAYLNAAEQLYVSLDQLLRTSLRKILGATPPAKVINATLLPILKSIRQEAKLVVSVHPDRALDFRIALKKAGVSDDSLEVHASEELSHDDCILYTDSSVINISIKVIVDQLVAALSGFIGSPVKTVSKAYDD